MDFRYVGPSPGFGPLRRVAALVLLKGAVRKVRRRGRGLGLGCGLVWIGECRHNWALVLVLELDVVDGDVAVGGVATRNDNRNLN